MPTLNREHRRLLENTVAQARAIAEEGARKVLRDQYAVENQTPWSHMKPAECALRNQLRAHGRQLGDRRDTQRGTQSLDHLVQACAYEHWHRMLFARFLADNDLLLDPEHRVPMTLDEVRELGREQKRDWLDLAADLAQRMLLSVFRSDDPALKVSLPPETRQQLEEKLESLPAEIFRADDSLGWVYQFWQKDEKERVNKSEVKIGADELAAVTQLFTEDYMVLFLLHNTLGAWWAGKVLGEKTAIAARANDEHELRAACSVGGYEWTYLRFVRTGDGGPWSPAAGMFDRWPRTAKELKILDPCMGSGHFLVFAFPILVAFRMEEEGLSREEAVNAALRDNLFGLELDNRCTQIAAFNLALTAWRMVGYRSLPPLNIACSGLGINAKEEEWLNLAGKDGRIRETMRHLYDLFQQAPVLGSLIDPKRVGGTLFVAEFEKVRPVFDRALSREQGDESIRELAVTARGLVDAAEILGSEFTLVTTNVPYLGLPHQDDVLKQYSQRFHDASKSDLATCFLERCLSFCATHGTASIVITQSWLAQPRYKQLRKKLLESKKIELLTKLGPRAFESISGEQVNVCMPIFSNTIAEKGHRFAGLDVTAGKTAADKRVRLVANPIAALEQTAQLKNPDHRITVEILEADKILARYASCIQGLATSDDPQFTCLFWEFPSIRDGWEGLGGTVERTTTYGGRERLIHWENGLGRYYRHAQALKTEGRLGGWKSGTEARGKSGVLVSQMSTMPTTIYTGEFYDHNASVIIVNDPQMLPAVWAFASSEEFAYHVRKLDQSLKPSNNVFIKVPFDFARWRGVAAEKYPSGLPKPHSDDPTQWLFNGNPKGSDHPLQVAIARLLGYRWPRQTGSSFPDCPALDYDELETHADSDGIVCLASLAGKPSAADRVRALLADAYGAEWSAAKLSELVDGYESLEIWLRDRFFEEHCEIFHDRPFVWHVWDGRKDGFHALVNYHKLAAPNGEGRNTLERLIYTSLGDWITRQRAEVGSGVEGADARLTAALHLKSELEKIVAGEKPYDIFVRWKSIQEQPLGWAPDINDGVRLNIRPWLTAKPYQPSRQESCILRITPRIPYGKDRGKEPSRSREEFPWFWSWDGKTDDFGGDKEFDGVRWNELHYSLGAKEKARERQLEAGARR